jgi:hypothetical protein
VTVGMWIDIAYERDRRCAAVNTVMKQVVFDWLNVGLSYTDTLHRTGSVFCRENIVDDEVWRHNSDTL